MKRNTKIWILALTSLASIPIISSSCTTQKKDTKKEPKKEDEIKKDDKKDNSDSKKDDTKPSQFLEENLNVLALGDSITAGFNSEYTFELAGNFDSSKDTRVRGLSYPSFLVDLLQRVKSNFVKSYDNFALSGSKIVDWLYLLDAPNFEYGDGIDKAPFKFLLGLDGEPNNPFRHRIKEQFDDFSKPNLLKLQNKIKAANFITLSLGANDLFQNLNIDLLKKVFQNPSEENIELFKNSITQIYQDNANNLDLLLKRIKQLNNDVKIVVVGYPFIFLRARPIVDELLNGSDVALKIFDKLNSVNKQVAKANKVVYVETYDEKTWLPNAKTLANSIFDIHPTEEGYKKMAIELFRKLAFNYNDPSEINNEQNQKYLEKDYDSIRKLFETSQDNEKLQEILNKFASEKTIYQKEINSQKSSLFSVEKHFIKNVILSGDALVGSVLEKIFGKDETVSQLLESNEFKEKIISAITRANLVDKIDLEIQKYFDETNLPVNKENLINKFVKFLVNPKIFLDGFKEFINTNFTDNEKIALAKIVANLANKIDLIDPALTSIKENKEISNFVEKTVFQVLSNKDEYLKADSFLDVISIYFKNNPNISFKSIIKSFVSNDFVFEKLFEQLTKIVPKIAKSKNFIKTIFQTSIDFKIFDKIEKFIIKKFTNKQINFNWLNLDKLNINKPSLDQLNLKNLTLNLDIFNDLDINSMDLLDLVKDLAKLAKNNSLKDDLKNTISIIVNTFLSKYSIFSDANFLAFKNSIIDDFIDHSDEYEKELQAVANQKITSGIEALIKAYLRIEENSGIVKKIISSLMKNVSENDKLLNAVAFGIQKTLQLENYDEKDDYKIKNLVKSVMENIEQTPLFNKVLDSILSQLKAGTIKLGSLDELANSIDLSFIVKDLSQVSSLLDIFENNKIKSEHVVDFLNLIVEKSPLEKIQDLTITKTPLFYTLNNLEKFNVNSSLTIGISTLSNLSLISKLKLFSKPVLEKIANNENVEENKKFLYRLSAIILYSAYEGYFKNASSFIKNTIFYNSRYSLLPTVSTLVFNALNDKNSENILKEIFGDIYSHIGEYEANISAKDLVKIVYYNNENNKDGILWRQKLFEFIKKGKVDN
ncbi:hypothetical protein DA803_01670 [[Mycoplasma] phocae]|uniref:Uncharacterized protein n=1 Tax=[Mycoplasma] phocae TaxID=142651 RepID=A0A2Z5IQG9_9BACT|nr:SGNH/GDSL hydrolase family protein [[Mycoplasma] phocae]AXE60792.1 hypothetical protein DA803_01670 [[Mycoplasma] phocae]